MSVTKINGKCHRVRAPHKIFKLNGRDNSFSLPL